MTDKIEIGKWYHCPRWGYSTDAVKVISIRDGCVVFYKERINADKYDKFDVEYWWSFDILIPVKIDQLKKYLPKGHPDLRSLNINNYK